MHNKIKVDFLRLHSIRINGIEAISVFLFLWHILMSPRKNLSTLEGYDSITLRLCMFDKDWIIISREK